MSSENKDKQEAFAIVPRALTTSGKFDATDKVMITHLLERYRIPRDNGHPNTFSVAGIAKGTALSEKTVRRHIGKLTGYKILNHYGTLRNEKTFYPVYAFDVAALNRVINTKDKLSLVIAPQTLNETPSDDLTGDKLSDKLSDKMPSKSNMIKGKIVQGTKESTSTGNPDLKALEDFFQDVPEKSSASIQGSGPDQNKNIESVGVGCSHSSSATTTGNSGVFDSEVGDVSTAAGVTTAAGGNKNVSIKRGLSVSAPSSKEERAKQHLALVESLEKKYASLPKHQRDLKINADINALFRERKSAVG